MQGTWIPSLVGELRSHMLRGKKKKKEKKHATQCLIPPQIYKVCVGWCSQDRPQVPWFTRRTQKAKFIVLVMLLFNTENEYKAKSARTKGTYGKSWENKAQGFQSPLPVKLQRMCLSIPPTMSCNNISEILSTRKAHYPAFLLGADHICTLCLVCTKISESQKESMSSA